MSSPIAIPISSTSTTKDVYVPVHKRGSSLSSSPSSSELSFMSRASSPAFSDASSSSHADMMIYTPEELLQIARSVPSIEPDLRRTLRSVAPEIVVTRKRSKAAAWHARHPNPHSSSSPTPTTTTATTTTSAPLSSHTRASHRPNGRRAKPAGKRDHSPSSQSDNWRSS